MPSIPKEGKGAVPQRYRSRVFLHVVKRLGAQGNQLLALPPIGGPRENFGGGPEGTAQKAAR